MKYRTTRGKHVSAMHLRSDLLKTQTFKGESALPLVSEKSKAQEYA